MHPANNHWSRERTDNERLKQGIEVKHVSGNDVWDVVGPVPDLHTSGTLSVTFSRESMQLRNETHQSVELIMVHWLRLSDRTKMDLSDAGFVEPTPIQMQVGGR